MNRAFVWAVLLLAGCSGKGSLLAVALSARGSVSVGSVELAVTAQGRTRTFPIQVGRTIPPDFIVGIELPPDVTGTARVSADFNGVAHTTEGVIVAGQRTDVRLYLDETEPPDLGDSDLSGADLLPSPSDMAIDMSGPVLTSDVSSFDFNTVLANSKTAIATLRFRNFGGIPTASLVTTRGGTSATELELVTDTCAGTTLAAGGGSCAIDVRFSPTSAGQKTATLSLSGVSVTLTVLALTPNSSVTISPMSQVFGATAVGMYSARQMVKVTNNTANVIVMYTDINANNPNFVASSDNTVTPYCSVGYAIQIPGNTFCYAFVQSRPTIAGPIGGAYEVRVSSKTGQLLAVESLAGQGGTGDGAPVLTVFLLTGYFPATYFGNTSQPLNFVVSNSGGQYSAPITLSTMGDSSQFEVTGDCSGQALHPSRTCTLRVAFKPTAAAGAGAKMMKLTASATPGGSVSVNVYGESGAYCTVQTDCASTQYCDTTAQTCLAKKGPGSNCTYGYECISGSCSSDNDCG